MKVMILLCASVIISCSHPLAAQGVPQNSHDILLQESRGGNMYIFLKRDTAFYESYVVDKPSYFSGFDTLVLTNDATIYKGKTAQLTVNETAVTLLYLSGRHAGKDYLFSIANAKQKKKWDARKNQIAYSTLHPVVDKLIWPYTTGSAGEQIKTDWERIRSLIDKLDQAGFNAELKKFKITHSIL